MPDRDIEDRLQAVEHHLEALSLQVARIEKALEDLAFWADMAGFPNSLEMASTIRRALHKIGHP